MTDRTDGQSNGMKQRCILLVEDNGILAMNIQEMLHELGAEEVLVGASVAQSLPLAEHEGLDLAILDFDLGSETSTPVALRLQALGIPFILASGYGHDLDLPAELADSPILKKPYMMEDIRKAIAALPESTGSQ